MNATARKCLIAGIALCVAGAIAMTYVPDLYGWLAMELGARAAAGMRLIEVALNVVRWTTFPLGSTFVGVAILIQVLLRELPARMRFGVNVNPE